MWAQAVGGGALRAALAGASTYRQQMLRLFGIPESEIAETLRVAEREGVRAGAAGGHDVLETGRDRGRHPLRARRRARLRRVRAGRRSSATPTRCSRGTAAPWTSRSRRCCAGRAVVDGALLEAPAEPQARREALTIATAESCTGGLLAARLTEPAGASEYVKGGIVAYSNEVKVSQAGVPGELIERHGAVSAEVARALAEGAQLAAGRGRGSGGYGRGRSRRRQRREAGGARLAERGRSPRTPT